MGHKRVTVQQRLLWDWRMEMEREACEETRATEKNKNKAALSRIVKIRPLDPTCMSTLGVGMQTTV